LQNCTQRLRTFWRNFAISRYKRAKKTAVESLTGLWRTTSLSLYLLPFPSLSHPFSLSFSPSYPLRWLGECCKLLQCSLRPISSPINQRSNSVQLMSAF